MNINFSFFQKHKKLTFVGLLLISLILVEVAVYSYYQFAKPKPSPSKIESLEATEILEKVGRLIVLPEDEEPTIATVTDPEKLKDQLFFAKAKIGDKLLIYSQARKAILYDPVADKIVEVAPLNIEASGPAQ